MNRIDTYLGEVSRAAGLPLANRHVQEVRLHLLDLVEEQLQRNVPADVATEQALQELGAATLVGGRLRRVVPLPIHVRDWISIAIGVVLGALYYQAHLSGILATAVWLLVAVIIAMGSGRPFLGALSPLVGLLAAHALKHSVVHVSGQDSLLVSVLLGSEGFLPTSIQMVLTCIMAGLFVGWARGQARLRTKPFSVDQVIAGMVHLAPFLILTGVTGGAAAFVILALVWYANRHKSQFLTRHAVQALAIVGGGVLSQVLLYELNSYAGLELVPAFSLLHNLALALVVVRFVVGVLAAHAALSALMGYAFTYPFARRLLPYGTWREAPRPS